MAGVAEFVRRRSAAEYEVDESSFDLGLGSSIVCRCPGAVPQWFCVRKVEDTIQRKAGELLAERGPAFG